MYFALDTHDAALLVSSLRQAFSASNDVNALASTPHYLALVDSAFDHGHQPLKWPSQAACVYGTHERLAALSHVSPRLLVLSEPGSPEFEADVRRLSRHCNGRPMLSFLHSAVSAEALSEQWQKCLMLQTQDGSDPYLLRLADTRALPALTTLPSKALWATLTQSVKQWLIVGRTGVIQALDLAKQVPATLAAQKQQGNEGVDLTISDKDLAHLLSHSQADSVIGAMEEHFPESLPKGGHAMFYDHVAQACTLAELNRIDAFPDVMALAMASHLTQGQVLNHVQVIKLLESRHWQSGQLGDALSEYLSEDVL